MHEIVIPAALQINMDDIGWWNGDDDRAIGGPSRSGMPRHHSPEDYLVIAELGQALDMEINCGIVLGEWDMENRLAKEVKYFSHYGDRWNNAAYRDPKAMREAVEIMNSSRFIDVTLHGLYHGYYMPGVDHPDISDYYYKKDGVMCPVPEEEIRNRLDHFFRICEYHGMTSEITHFIPPSNAYGPLHLSAILKDYGIKTAAPILTHISKSLMVPDLDIKDVFVENGIVTVNRGPEDFPWDQVASDFEKAVPHYGIFGIHWPNILHMDPAQNCARVKEIVPYFRRSEQIFGIILSRNMSFAATQALYGKYAKSVWMENTCVMDLSEVPDAAAKRDSFFISAKEAPVSFENCTVGEIRRMDTFTNYEIRPAAKTVKIHF